MAHNRLLSFRLTFNRLRDIRVTLNSIVCHYRLTTYLYLRVNIVLLKSVVKTLIKGLILSIVILKNVLNTIFFFVIFFSLLNHYNQHHLLAFSILC